MTAIRALKGLGFAARSVRRVGLGQALKVGVDAADRALLCADWPPLAAEFEGVELRGYLRHRGFLDYVRRGLPEESFYLSLLVNAVDSRTTFVDAGAHIGLYTLLAAGRARRVIAFEPDPYNFAALRWNVGEAGCTNVEIRAQAVADKAGQGTFRAFRSTISGSLLPREVDDYQELEIELVPLDDVLSDADLDGLVVKLDVEGAEPLVLAGMRRALEEARRLLLVSEINPEALAAGGSTPSALLADLLVSDLECALVDEVERGLLRIPADERLKKGNIACWRSLDPERLATLR